MPRIAEGFRKNYLSSRWQPQSRTLIFMYSIVCAFTLISSLYFWTNYRNAAPSSYIFPTSGGKSSNAVIAIANKTLGFQQIFALVLPDREDRKTSLLDAANATNISLTIVDAVKDDQIPQDKWPQGWGAHLPGRYGLYWQGFIDPRYGELGCLRSHAMTWERIIKDKIATALIMESDADWDLRAHEILPNIADGVKNLSTSAFPSQTPELVSYHQLPYGYGWDLLWMGHCGTHGKNGRDHHFLDPTVPPPEHEYTWHDVPKPDLEFHPNGTRVIFEAWRTMCTSAYAISYEGAIKMRNFLNNATSAIDNEMSALCAKESSLTCYTVWPQIFTAAPSKSNIVRPSDEQVPGTDTKDNTSQSEIAWGPALQYSARRNAHIVAQGLGRNEWIKEW